MSALLPPGFRFHPSDIELIGYYLRRKLAGALISVPQFLIRDFDIYSTEPWNLPSDSFRYQSEQKDMYFFTPRRPTTKGSQRADRTAGCGMWQGNGADYRIKDGSKTIGHRTQLTFMSGKEKKKTNWIMHEFRLHSPSNTTKFDAMVLCRIHLKKTKKCREEEVDADAAAAAVGSAFGEKEKEEAEGRLVKRKRVEERGLITDYGLVNNELSSQSSSSLLPGMPALLSYEELEVLTSLTSDMASVASVVDVPVSEQEAETEERRVIRRLLEELKKMTANGEKGTYGIFNTVSSVEHASLLSYEEPGVPAPLTPVMADGVVSVDEQEAAETEERQVKRRRIKEPEHLHGLMADNNERGSCMVVNTESTIQPSSFSDDLPLADLLSAEDFGSFPPPDPEFHGSSSSYLAPLPALLSYEEPEVLTSLASDVASVGVVVDVPVSEQEAETEERRVIRRLLEEHEKMTAHGEKGTNGIFNTESSGEHASLLSYEESGIPAPFTPVVDGVAVAVSVDEQEAAETEERQVKRRRIEEPEQKQGLMADNNEMGSCGVVNTESTSQPSSFSDDFPLPDLFSVEDFSSFLPPEAEFHPSSSSFLAPLPAASHVPDGNFIDDLRCLPLDCWEESDALALLASNNLDFGFLSSLEDVFDVDLVDSM